MMWAHKASNLVAAAALIVVGIYFSTNIPTVGASGEALSIGGAFYPTDLVLWLMWFATIVVAGVFAARGLRPD